MEMEKKGEGQRWEEREGKREQSENKKERRGGEN